MRFKCKLCGKGSSEATFDLAFSQKRRDLDCKIKRLLISGVTMRRCAKLLNTTRTTVARKLTFLGIVAEKRQKNFFARMRKVERVQFDEMMSVEHTKCKPVAIALAVSEDERYLL